MEYSLEELNYIRMCRVAVKLVPEGLRKVFKQEWDFLYSTRPGGPWQDTTQNGTDFYLMETTGKKSKMKMSFLNDVRNGDSAEWDSSCLISAILSSNAIGSTLASSIHTAVDDLRQVRNDIAHIDKNELTDHDFQSYATKVIEAFTTLCLPITEVEGVKNQKDFPTDEVKALKKSIGDLKTKLDQTDNDLSNAKDTNDAFTTKLDQVKSELDAKTSTLQRTQDDLSAAKEEDKALAQEIASKFESFCSLTLAPPHEIIRRDCDIQTIEEKMQELRNRSNGAVSTVYLSGNPGCGKSQLARQIGDDFFRLKSRGTDGHALVATLNAQTLKTLVDSYITLAKRLSVTEYAHMSKTASPEETLKQMRRIISPKIAKFENWLIIADNVVNLLLVREHLPQTASKEWGHGQVLITTQDSNAISSNAPLTYHESLSRGMQPDDAVELLKQVSQVADQQDVESVAEALEYQPLALAAAAYYVQSVSRAGSPKYNWTNYLNTLSLGLREATAKLLAKESSAYSYTMTVAVKLAIQRAMETSQVIHQAFSILSLCASESIPVDIVVDFVAANTQGNSMKELIKADILKSSLIVRERDGGSSFIGVHNIVHDILKRTITNSDSICSQKHQTITTAIYVFDSHLEKYFSTEIGIDYGNLQLRKIAAHSKAFCDIAFPEDKLVTSIVNPKTVVTWVKNIAKAYRLISEPKHANRFSKLACDVFENIACTGITSQLKSDVFQLRGEIMFDMCDFKSALFYHQKALTTNREIHGEEHFSVANCYYDLAGVYQAMQDHRMTRELFSKALLIFRKLVPEKELGRDSCYRLNAGNKNVYKDQRDEDVRIYFMMANCYHYIGEYDQAMELQKKALSITEEAHRLPSKDVAYSYRNLAYDYRKIGDHNQSIDCNKKALRIMETIHGEVHSDVAECHCDLTIDYGETGDYNQAIESGKKALSITEKVHSEAHSDVAKNYHNLAVNYSRIGDHNQAIECNKKALSIREKIHGEVHSDVADSYYSLAVNYSEIGNYIQAMECNKEALSIREKIHGEVHGDVADSYYSLAVNYNQVGNYSQAIECNKKALSIREKIHGEVHSDVADSYYAFAINYSRIGDHNQAIECNKKALSIREKIHGEAHSDVAKTYYSLAVNYSRTGDHNQAMECDKKALSIRQKIHGEVHSDVADSYYSLAVNYRKIGDYNQAIECDQKALSIREKVHGEVHSDVADSYYALAVNHSRIGDHNQAIECNKKALSIREKIHGEVHSGVANSYYSLAINHRKIGDYNQAIECDQKALSIREKIYGEVNSDVAKSYYSLAVNHRKIGDYNQAIECDQKALSIRERVHGEVHSDVAKSYYSLAVNYSRTGNHKQAMECVKKALSIREKIYGEVHSDVADSYYSLAVNYNRIGTTIKPWNVTKRR